jgi:hypothetical protein
MGVKPARFVLLAALILLTGCKIEGKGPLVDAVNIVLETELHTLLGMSALWSVIGGVVGLAAGVLAYVVVRKLGGYDWGWAHAKWIRWLTCAVVVLGTATAGGAIGLGKGASDGFEVVLRKSQLATEVFPVAGDVAADLIAMLYLELSIDAATDDPSGAQAQAAKAERASKLTAFRAGTFEIDVVNLAEGANTLQSARVAEIVEELEDEVLTQFPSWRGGAFEKVLNTVLVTLGEALVSHEVKKLGLGKLVRQMQRAVKALPKAAAKTGDPNRIDRAELSEHVVQFGVVPALMLPVRSFIRGYQFAAAAAFLGLLLLPVCFFRGAEFIRNRRGAASSDDEDSSPTKTP